MDLYFTRHGRTEWNKELRFQGATGDSPLLPHSYEEIKLLGEFLKDVPFQAIIASPLKRALDTAKEINRELVQPVNIETADGLKEMGLGELEGQKIAAMQEIYPTQLNALRRFPDQYDPRAFAGETFPSVVKRFEGVVLKAMREAQSDAPILFVSHGAALTAAIHAMIGEDLADLRKMGGINNNSLTILRTEDGQLPFQLVTYNDTTFLKEERSLVSGDELI